MIRSFLCRDTEALYNGARVARFQAIQQQAERRLQILDSAVSLDDLRNLPSNHFKALTGDRTGQYSIRINRQWRICFRWSDDGPDAAEIVDYH
jgi:toxin HigB-1